MALIRTSLLQHFLTGEAYFSGAFCLIAAAGAARSPTRGRKRLAAWLWLIGLLLVALSAAALPWWHYAMALLVSVLWLVRLFSTSQPTSGEGRRERRRRIWAVLYVGVWLIGVGLELPFHITPRAPMATGSSFAVIGDSLSAGMDDPHMTTWPRRLAERRQLEIVDLSRMGATTASAAARAREELPRVGLVVILIGGNDLLGSTSPRDFERSLDELLTLCAERGEQTLMFELPLPPFRNDFGRAQRKLAARHGAGLAPRRALASALLSADTTLDSIHLNQAGHDRLAETIWGIVQPR